MGNFCWSLWNTEKEKANQKIFQLQKEGRKKIFTKEPNSENKNQGQPIHSANDFDSQSRVLINQNTEFKVYKVEQMGIRQDLTYTLSDDDFQRSHLNHLNRLKKKHQSQELENPETASLYMTTPNKQIRGSQKWDETKFLKSTCPSVFNKKENTKRPFADDEEHLLDLGHEGLLETRQSMRR